MNTLKSAALTVVLLGVLYGVYVALNKPDFPIGVTGHHPAELAAPMVEYSAPPASAPPMRNPAEPSPAPALENRPAQGSAYQANAEPSPARTPAAPSWVPDTSIPAANSPLGASTSPAPPLAERADQTPVTPADLTATTPSPSAIEPAAATPTSNPNSSGTTAALAAWSLKRDWQEAEQFVGQGKFKAALEKLSPYYANADLPTEQRAPLIAWLDALAAKVIYSREHLLATPHTVRKNETLFEIADQYKVPWRLLANINSREVSDTMVLVPGTTLKVVPGPFRADVNLAGSELTLYLGEMYAGHFPLTLGNQPPTPGQYKIIDKMSQQKSYYGLDGRVIPANDPANPYGGWWLSLGGEVAIHGSPSAPGAQTLGCISLSPQDAKDVYGILSMGADVAIRR